MFIQSILSSQCFPYHSTVKVMTNGTCQQALTTLTFNIGHMKKYIVQIKIRLYD